MTTLMLPSVQSLLLQMSYNGSALSTGTGFVVRSPRGPVLITNRHNVTGRHQDTGALLSPTGAIPNEIRIIHNRKGRLGEWLTSVEPLYVNDAPQWIEHPQLGSKADFVSVPLTALGDVELYPYDPNNPGTPIMVGPADPVSVVGFPFGLQAGGSLAVWATGFVASEPQVDFNNLPIFLVDCRSRPGQSGSAVIAHRGGGMVAMEDGGAAMFNGPVTRLLGIYSGRINAESDLGIVWKVAAIAELIASM